MHKESGRFCPDEIGIIVNDLLTEHFPKIVDLDFTAQLEKDLDKIAQGDKDWILTLRNFYQPFNKTLQKASNAIVKINTDKLSDELCPICSKPMMIKNGRFGKFLACSGYPDCKTTRPLLIKTGISCPICKEKGEKGELVEKLSKKRRRFYGCSRYPECTFAINRKPIPNACPKCGNLLISTQRDRVKCTVCEFKGELPELDKVGARE